MHTAVISAENLSLLSADELAPLRRLVDALAGNDPVTVVTYCRRWSDRLPSLWAEQVKQGRGRAFAEWMLAQVSQPEPNGRIDESLRWSVWAALFGIENLRIVSYDVLMERKANIAADFAARFVGWQGAVQPPRAKSANRRLSPEELELMRLVNGIAGQNGLKPSQKARQALLRKLGQAESAHWALIETDRRRGLVIDDNAPMFDTARANMQAIADTAVVERDGDRRMMIPGSSVHPTSSPSLIANPAVGDFVREAYALLAEFSRGQEAA